jgi:chemotaxis protein histidine kinase CheA
LRRRLGQPSLHAGPATGTFGLLAEVSDGLTRALSLLGPVHPARLPIHEARRALTRASATSLAQLFEYLEVVARQTAASEGREPPGVILAGGSILVGPSAYQALAAALPHLVRNALCHGIEPSDERRRMEKPVVGCLEIGARDEDGALHLWVADDGRGFDAASLRHSAERLGITGESSEEGMLELASRPGVSTSDAVTLDRGRGVGLGAAREAIERAGGAIAVRSLPGRGAEFLITIPNRGES